MQKIVPGFKWISLLVGVLVFGGVSWLNGGPIGNTGAWLIVVLAISWPATLFGGNCAGRFRRREVS